jgi:cell division transport system ATP-binding protein
MIDFRGVSKRYGPGDIGLDQATFAISKGEFVFLVGATGSGKSTVMRLLIKELEPTEGLIRVSGKALRDIRAKVPDILRLTGLSTKLHNYPDQLSGGEQQRVSIARAFVNHPPLLLADEPTGNLDPDTSIDIMRLLYRINRTGTTVLVATHDQAMVDKMRRRVLELSRGRIVRDEIAGLYQADETTREFARRMRGDGGRPEGVE